MEKHKKLCQHVRFNPKKARNIRRRSRVYLSRLRVKLRLTKFVDRAGNLQQLRVSVLAERFSNFCLIKHMESKNYKL